MATQRWLKGDLGPRGPIHFSRIDPTEPKTMGRMADVKASVAIAPPYVHTETTNYATERAFAESDEHGAQTLFDHKEVREVWNEPGYDENDGWSTQEGRNNAAVTGLFYKKGESVRDLPAILGSAQMAAWQKWGTARGTLGASDDLSPHSAPIVERAKQRGVLPADTSTTVTNQNDKSEFIGNVDTRGTDRVSSFQLNQGKQIYRAVMGRERPDHTPTPMNQQELPF